MHILNPLYEDYHIHSLNFSDGLNTIDEIVKFSGINGLKKIVITDHSQKMLDRNNFGKKSDRSMVKRWHNVVNDIKVSFGIEADLLNAEGDICCDIQGKESDFIILSYHSPIFNGDQKSLTSAYINAIKRFHKKIKCLGHPCIRIGTDYLDIVELTKVANYYKIPMEINGSNLLNKKTDLEKLRQMLQIVDSLYINSDAHTLYELKNARAAAIQFLKDKGFL